MKLLDLFCGAGGAAMGYHQAGFDVTGVDLYPQKHYPFKFIQKDWKDGLHDIVRQWRWGNKPFAIHASPPCQRYSTMTKKWGREKNHPDLIGEVRDALKTVGVPYIIENVPGAPLINPIMLCGSMFKLGVNGNHLRRHRLFELGGWSLYETIPSCNHEGKAIGVYGHAGGSSKRDGLTFSSTEIWCLAMGINWMTGTELSESIPPVYTWFLGGQLKHLLGKGK
jgi:DNA (cytosine-5)-methyltransferase 1